MFVFSAFMGASKRATALLYLTCVLLSLAPSVVGPPERNFDQGQPELQQAMDNMPIRHDSIVKKAFPPIVDTKVSPFNSRAAALLEEAESMLTLSVGIKEKAWLESFIQKLKMLASILEQNLANYTRENEPYTFGTIKHTSDEAPGDQTVPETGPGQIQSNQETSNLPTAKSGAESVDHVTGIIPPLTDEVKDELVEELQSLHKLTSKERFDVNTPETSSKTEDLATVKVEGDAEEEKEKLLERIVKEVAELKKMGETDENILNAIHTEGIKLTEPLRDGKQQSPNEHATTKRVIDENNPQNWNRIPEPPRQVYMNNTFVGMHINLPPLNPRVFRRQLHYGYHGNAVMNNFPVRHVGLKGAMQNLQNEGNQNFSPRNRMYGAPNYVQQGNPIQQQRAGGRNRYGAAHPQTRSLNLDPLYNPYVNPNTRPLYMPMMPYPVNQKEEQKSSVNATSTTYAMSKEPAEFTEEMKRQLRDGKVILMSDSVVSSNYTTDEEKEEHAADEIKTKEN